MKVAIVGSRVFDDYSLLDKVITDYANCQPSGITMIISGGAVGADKMAERYAREHSIPIKLYLPDWGTYGKSAGAIRNALIVQECDICFAFWDGQSRGTKMDIDLCKQYQKQCIIINYKDTQTTLFQ